MSEISYYRMWVYTENDRRELGNLLVLRDTELCNLNFNQIDEIIEHHFFKDPSSVYEFGDDENLFYETSGDDGEGIEGIQILLEDEDINEDEAKRIMEEKDIFGNGLTWVLDTRDKSYKLAEPKEGILSLLSGILKSVS